jgi:thioredoxin-related protein
MKWTVLLSSLAVAVVAVLMSATPAMAQEVNWRRDYAAARKEATETGRPLLMDFGTAGCTWCRKLDATTFRDPRIVKLLNERFIPVKIDADREIRLVQALGIDSYPTIVLANPEGHVLGRQVGFAEVGEMSALLAKAPQRAVAAPVAAPREPAQPAPPVAAPREQALQVPAREPAVSGVLAQARADYEAKRYAECLRQCNLIMIALPTSPEAHEARQLAQQITMDPVSTRLVKDQINAGLATLQPKLAAALER